MSDLNHIIEPAFDAAHGGVDGPSSIQDSLSAQERRRRAAERLGAEIRTWPRDAEAGDIADVDADLDGDQGTLASVPADRKVLEAEIEADAERVVPGMSLDAIKGIRTPLLRAGALLMADMVTEHRANNRTKLALLVYSVEVPEAGDLGILAVATYRQAVAANSPSKQKAFAKALKSRVRDLSGFGRVPMIETALTLLQSDAAASTRDVAKTA